MNDLYNQLKSETFFIAGPCVIESEELLCVVAKELVRLKNKYNVNIIFKSSFDKANRTSIRSFRGRGIRDGLEMLNNIRKHYYLPIITDVHETHQIEDVSKVVDIIQIPAFLCRQTDLLIEAGKSNKIINIKKGQFISPYDIQFAIEKILITGNEKILLTERGNIFGYNNLVVDFKNISIMKRFGYPVVMDCTHSVQSPGSFGDHTGGDREFIKPMALSAKAFGADGYFIETHPNPDEAKSDALSMLFLNDLDDLIGSILNK